MAEGRVRFVGRRGSQSLEVRDGQDRYVGRLVKLGVGGYELLPAYGVMWNGRQLGDVVAKMEELMVARRTA